jgi:hypothetical protein
MRACFDARRIRSLSQIETGVAAPRDGDLNTSDSTSRGCRIRGVDSPSLADNQEHRAEPDCRKGYGRRFGNRCQQEHVGLAAVIDPGRRS